MVVLPRRTRALLGLISILPLLILAERPENEVDKKRLSAEVPRSMRMVDTSVNKNVIEPPNDQTTTISHDVQNVMEKLTNPSPSLISKRRMAVEDNPEFEGHRDWYIDRVSQFPNVTDPNITEGNEGNSEIPNEDVWPGDGIRDIDVPPENPERQTVTNTTDTNTTDSNTNPEFFKGQDFPEEESPERNTAGNTTDINATDTNTTDTNTTDTNTEVKANQSIVVDFEYKIDFFDDETKPEDVMKELKNMTKENIDFAIRTFKADKNDLADVIFHYLTLALTDACEPDDKAVSCRNGNGTISLAHSSEINPEFLFDTVLAEAEKAIQEFNEVRPDIKLTYLSPRSFSTQVYIDINGVPQQKMNEDDATIFEEVLLKYLEVEIPKLLGDHITIERVTIISEVISTTERRALRSEFAEVIRRDEEENSNRVLVSVEGTCGFGCTEPPEPEDIVSSIDEKSDEILRDLKTRSKNEGSNYFGDVKSFKPQPVEKPYIPDTSPVGENEISEDGYAFWALILIAAPVVAGVAVCFCFFRSVRSKGKSKDLSPINADVEAAQGPHDTTGVVEEQRDGNNRYPNGAHVPPPDVFDINVSKSSIGSYNAANVSKSTIGSYNVSKSTIVSAPSVREPNAPPFEQTNSDLWNRKMAMADGQNQSAEVGDEANPGPQHIVGQGSNKWERKMNVGNGGGQKEDDKFNDEDDVDSAPKPGARVADTQDEDLWNRKVGIGNENNKQQSGDNSGLESSFKDEDDSVGETKPGVRNVQGERDELWDRKVAVANEKPQGSNDADDTSETSAPPSVKSAGPKPGAQQMEDERDERWERKIAVAKETPAESDATNQDTTDKSTGTSKSAGAEHVKEDEDRLWARKMDNANKADDGTEM